MSIYILGGGGHAKVVLATLQAIGASVAGVLDDAPEKHGTTVLGVPVLGSLGLLTTFQNALAVIGIGDNSVRLMLADRFAGRVEWATAIHPRADVHPDVQVGEGAVVFSGAVVQPGAQLGRHAIVNTSATVDHDCTVGDFAHIAPGVHLAGDVRIGEGVLFGVGACASLGVAVGDWTVVGAGGVVVTDLPGGVTAFGVPARPRFN